MYCKYCGNHISDDSIFCTKCGKFVEAITTTKAYYQREISPQWLSTVNLQWRRPYMCRIIQIMVLAVLLVYLVYSVICIIAGGNVTKNYGRVVDRYGSYSSEREYVRMSGESILEITDIIGLFNLNREQDYSTFVPNFDNNPAQYFIYKEYEIDTYKKWFRIKILFIGIILPLTLILITIYWVCKVRFPNEKDLLPRDIADEMEKYRWNGLSKHKYVLYKKDGKYGIVDAKNYCINVPAKYDSILWRQQNKTYDVTLNGRRETLTIVKSIVVNQDIEKLKYIGNSVVVAFILCGLVSVTMFTLIVPFICILTPNDDTPIATIIGLFVAFPVFLYITYRAFISYRQHKH